MMPRYLIFMLRLRQDFERLSSLRQQVVICHYANAMQAHVQPMQFTQSRIVPLFRSPNYDRGIWIVGDQLRMVP